MKSSLRHHLFLYLLLSAIVVIAANRAVAIYLISLEIHSQIENDMQRGLRDCVHHVGDRQAFLACYRARNEKSISRQVSDFVAICGPARSNTNSATRVVSRENTYSDANTGAQGICDSVNTARVRWVDDIAKQSAVERWMPFLQPKADWTGARLGPGAESPQLLLKSSEIDTILEQIWRLRDTKLIYVFPVIISLLIFALLSIMRMLMASVVSLEKSLLTLTPDNFNKPREISIKYREFESITKIYQDLCARLDESFRRARSFTSDASHELKTPLTILRGTAERLIADLPSGTQVQILARGMADEVERLIKISEQLLLLSRADANALMLQRQEFNLSAFIDQLADDAVIFEKNMTIHKDIDDDVVWYCDPVLVKQLVHNLYTNAVKYNVPHGRIDFELRRHASTLVLRIANTSAQVSRDLTEHAFDRFYRGDVSHNRTVDGLGLGLSICLEIAKSHHSTLTFEADVTPTVTLTLHAPLRF